MTRKFNSLFRCFKINDARVADMPTQLEIPKTPKQYLVCTKSISEQAFEKTSESCSLPPKFNHGQCKYLAEKLRVAVDKAQKFLSLLNSQYEASFTQDNQDKFLEVFKLLYAFSIEAASFIRECCKPAWIQAAMKLTNPLEHVSAIGFNLELCAIVFSGSMTRTEGGMRLSATDLVDEVGDDVVETVLEKVSLDKDALVIKLEAEVQSLLINLRTRWSISSIASTEDINNYKLGSRLLELLQYIPATDLQGSLPEEFCESKNRNVRVLQKLGNGSDATVYRANWLGVEVAEKEMHLGNTLSNIRKEVLILAPMSHSNITTLFGYTTGKRVSILTNLMDRDLYSLIQERMKGDRDFPFPLLVAIDIMLQFAGGMFYVHGREIGHRDLKSQNILVKRVANTDYVKVEITDFGDSKMKEWNDMTRLTPNKGSLRWKAPETLKCAGAQSDELMSYNLVFQKVAKCDVYSFAMVCYEVLTGKRPFSEILDGEPKKIKDRIKNGPPLSIPDQYPMTLKSLIEECWSLEPQTRHDFAVICKKLRYLKYELLMIYAWGKISTLFHDPTISTQPLDTRRSSWSMIEATSEYYARILCMFENDTLASGFDPIARIQQMIDSRLEFNTEISRDIKLQISRTSTHWSALEVYSSELDESEVAELNLEYFELLRRRHYVREGDSIDYTQRSKDDAEDTCASLFREYDGLEIGEKFAEGGQAEIFEVTWMGEAGFAAKVFKKRLRLQDFEKCCPHAFLKYYQNDDPQITPLPGTVLGATLLEDGRFAIVMVRRWGDLRALIDLRMLQAQNRGPPFSPIQLLNLMEQIAEDMILLHEQHPPILHRDLKASNILVYGSKTQLDLTEDGMYKVTVADFETSVGVVGTGFWRAPEILDNFRNGSVVLTDKCDVYSYGMTCYELATGRIPFEERASNDYAFVVEGGRPDLPPDLNSSVKDIVTSCWNPIPSERPSFRTIQEWLKGF